MENDHTEGDSLSGKLNDSAVYAAGVKAITDAHLKEMGRLHFVLGAPSLVPPWPLEDSRDDPHEDPETGL